MENFMRRFFVLWKMLINMRCLRNHAIFLITAVLFCTVLTGCVHAKAPNSYTIPENSQDFKENVQPPPMDCEQDSVGSMDTTPSNEVVPDSPTFSSSHKQPNELLSNLNIFASFGLKIFCMLTLVEVIKYLDYLRKCKTMRQQRRKERLQKRREKNCVAQKGKDLYDFDSESCDELSIVPVSASDEHLVTNLCADRGGLIPLRVSTPIFMDKEIIFGFQDTDKALKIMNGTEQGCIYLKRADGGELLGVQMSSDLYQVSPRTFEMTERNLRYSAITACFNISGEVKTGKIFKIRVDDEAVLRVAGVEIYVVDKKGRITVIGIVE